MNRKQAGLLALGVLAVALAIVTIGVVSNRPENTATKSLAEAQTGSGSATDDGSASGSGAAKSSGAASNADAAPAGKEARSGTGGAGAKTDGKLPAGQGAPAKSADGGTASDKQDAASAGGSPKDQSMASLGQDASKLEQLGASAGPSKSAATSGSDKASGDASLPTFDVVRVEPDGSTLIAGHADPKSQVHIMNGDSTIATTDADGSGDFVALLDKPLKPGDYELALKSVDKNSKSKTSSQVATISVPKDRNGQLLAMISQPGQASRLITVPRPESLSPVRLGDAGNDSAAPAQQDLATREAAPSEEDGAASLSSPTATASKLHVDAVEMEGDSIYVAGSAPPGSTVRVYADNVFVGSTKTAADGRFVVDGSMPLSPGHHVIRADLIGSNGDTVVVRATVPFERPDEPGRFAAVSPGAAAAKPSEAVGKLDSQARKALGDLDTAMQAAAPDADTIEKARRQTEQSLEALSQDAGDEGADAAQSAADKAVRAKAAAALGKIKGLPTLSPDTKLTSDQLNAMRSSVKDASDAMTAEAAGGATASSGPKTTVQPALTRSDSYVIIRRGDNLWQISRRVYGRGIRYTTIYMANTSQISNPNMIMPGQVFDLPTKPSSTIDQAEEMHRKLLREERRN